MNATTTEYQAQMRRLEQELAYSLARDCIECHAVRANDFDELPALWDIEDLDNPPSDPEIAVAMAGEMHRAVTYLEWRGCIGRVFGSRHIVHIKDAS